PADAAPRPGDDRDLPVRAHAPPPTDRPWCPRDPRLAGGGRARTGIAATGGHCAPSRWPSQGRSRGAPLPPPRPPDLVILAAARGGVPITPPGRPRRPSAGRRPRGPGAGPARPGTGRTGPG